MIISLRPLSQGSLLAASLAPICRDVGLRGARWPRDILLRVAVWFRMVCGCGSYHHREHPVCCTEVATLRAIDKVSPGPDLDALIAEDVFGWRNVHRHQGALFGKKEDKLGRWRSAKVPNFSTNPIHSSAIEERIEGA